MKKKALIIGVTGQDGAFLAKYLLEKIILFMVPLGTKKELILILLLRLIFKMM